MIIADYEVKKQRFNEDTPLVAWVRCHPLLKSNESFGYVRSDVDMVWYNYIFGLLMILEDKSRGAKLHGSQRATLSVLDQIIHFCLRHTDFRYVDVDPLYPRPEKNYYCGFHVVRFENTGPIDGQTFVDDVPVTIDQLSDFFQFKWTPSIQVYRDLADELSACNTLKTFLKSANHIKKTVPNYHPEYPLLDNLSRGKKKEVARREVSA